MYNLLKFEKENIFTANINKFLTKYFRSSHRRCFIQTFSKFHRKLAVLEFLFNKVSELKVPNLLNP